MEQEGLLGMVLLVLLELLDLLEVLGVEVEEGEEPEAQTLALEDLAVLQLPTLLEQEGVEDLTITPHQLELLVPQELQMEELVVMVAPPPLLLQQVALPREVEQGTQGDLLLLLPHVVGTLEVQVQAALLL